ncbi:hypothetical protein Q3G72_032865 [Acer saccharum]|nr:hypothetical protein Q3G72_032865 [Acer saccharum]
MLMAENSWGREDYSSVNAGNEGVEGGDDLSIDMEMSIHILDEKREEPIGFQNRRIQFSDRNVESCVCMCKFDVSTNEKPDDAMCNACALGGVVVVLHCYVVTLVSTQGSTTRPRWQTLSESPQSPPKTKTPRVGATEASDMEQFGLRGYIPETTPQRAIEAFDME